MLMRYCFMGSWWGKQGENHPNPLHRIPLAGRTEMFYKVAVLSA